MKILILIFYTFGAKEYSFIVLMHNNETFNIQHTKVFGTVLGYRKTAENHN